MRIFLDFSPEQTPKHIDAEQRCDDAGEEGGETLHVPGEQFDNRCIQVGQAHRELLRESAAAASRYVHAASARELPAASAIPAEATVNPGPYTDGVVRQAFAIAA